MTLLEESSWDPSMPGAGAQRATAIAQLYFRMAGYSPFTVLVADALCLVFGADGATKDELVDYFGLKEEQVLFGFESIPQDMRCTSAELQSEASASTRAQGPTDVGGDAAIGSRSEGNRMFLNFKRLLPAAYAHITKMLLSLCAVPLPASSYTRQVRMSLAKSIARPRAVGNTAPTVFMRSERERNTATETDSVEGGANSTTTAGPSEMVQNLSEPLRRKEALEGIFCRGCRFYFILCEFDATLAHCPSCGSNVLRLLLDAIKGFLQRRCEAGESLVVMPHGSQQRQQQQQRKRPRLGPTCPSSPTAPQQHDSEGLDCSLARDPFLVQQALAFYHLYSTLFACATDARCAVDVEEILTEPEYVRRLQGRATVADRFRAAHRTAASVHVKLVSQLHVETAQRESNARKIAKRANLPPWLQHTTTVSSLSTSSTGPTADLLAMEEGMTTDKTALTGEKKMSWGDVKESKESKQEALVSTAHYIATKYFEDDFDAVPLPLCRVKSGHCGVR